MKYNPKRHIELLQRAEDFQQEGKDIFRENREEGFELLHYGAEVEAHFFWQDRDQLAFWMKNFLTQEIDDESF